MARLGLDLRSRDDAAVIADSLPHLVWIAQPDGTIVYLNQRFKEYTGIEESSLGNGKVGVTHEDDYERTVQAWQRALETGEAYKIEYRLRNATDGTYRWFVARAEPIRDKDGKIASWVGTATDIDSQQRMTEGLRFVIESSTTLATLDSEQAITDALARIAVESAADWTFVVMRNDDGTFYLPSIGHRDPELVKYVESYRERYPIDTSGASAQAIMKNEGQLTPVVTDEMLAATARDAEHLEVILRLGIRSGMVVPISTGTAPALGAIVLCSSTSHRRYEQNDYDVALAVANYAAQAIVNVRALERERQTSTVFRFVAQAKDVLSQSLDLDEAVSRLLRLATASIADVTYVWRVYDDGSIRMTDANARDPKKLEILSQFIGDRPLHREGERLLRTRFSGEAYLLEPFSNDSLDLYFFQYAREPFSQLQIDSFLCLPLHIGGAPAGGLIFARTEGWHFATDEVAAFKDLARHLNLAIEQREVLRRERRISRELQQALLPDAKMLPGVGDLMFDALYQTNSVDADIGGDWYDAMQLPDGRIVVSVGDVTGRGLSAAGAMGKLRQALSAIALYEPDPARMLDALELLLKRRSTDAIATAFVGVISADRQTLTYASAGHPYPLLKRETSLEFVKSEGLPIGLREHATSQSRVLPLAGAQMLILYTDGLVEATRDLFAGEAKLRAAVESDAILFARSPTAFLRDACLPEGSRDDAAILTISFGADRQWNFDAENAEAAHDARTDFMNYLRQRADEGDFEAAEIIFGELVGNVVRHAPGPIDALVDWTGEYPVLHITDRGNGFSRKPSLPRDPMMESGRGLYIIESLSRSLWFEHVQGYGTHVAVELPVRRNVAP